MESPHLFAATSWQAGQIVWCELLAINQYKEPRMRSKTIAIDVAKDVFQLAIADDKLRVTDSVRLSRKQFLP
jgi:hypothetical protein